LGGGQPLEALVDPISVLNRFQLGAGLRMPGREPRASRWTSLPGRGEEVQRRAGELGRRRARPLADRSAAPRRLAEGAGVGGRRRTVRDAPAAARLLNRLKDRPQRFWRDGSLGALGRTISSHVLRPAGGLAPPGRVNCSACLAAAGFALGEKSGGRAHRAAAARRRPTGVLQNKLRG